MNIRCILIGLVLLGPQAQASTIEKTTVHTTVNVPVWIVLPDKAQGKVPAVLLLHGTVGPMKQREWVYAEKFSKMGIASIIINSFEPRGIKNTLANQAAVTAAQMSDDALAVLQIVANHPKINGDKIALMGFSKGGEATLRTVYATFNKPGKKDFALLIGMYPSCSNYRMNNKTTGKPIRLISAAKDGWVNPQGCEDISKNLKAAGADIQHTVLPNAEHGWDVPGPAHKVTPTAENYSKCKFIQKPNAVWVEEKSQLPVADENGARKDRDLAVRNCMTYGVSSGYSAEATAKSWDLIKGYLAVITKD